MILIIAERTRRATRGFSPPENLKAFFAMLNFVEKHVNATKFWGDEQKKGHQLFSGGKIQKNFQNVTEKFWKYFFVREKKFQPPPPEPILRAPLTSNTFVE